MNNTKEIPIDLIMADEQLPIELPTQVPEHLQADFSKLVKAVPVDVDGDGKYDYVDIEGCQIPRERWEEDKFNDRGKAIPRHNANRVQSNKELIEKFNTYDFSGSKLAKVGGTALICATFGGYYFGKRRFIPPGYFGHYKSSGRHMLTAPGIHIITSVAEQWEKPIPIDPEQDGSRLIRTYGDKTILQVPENHIAGGYKIGCVNKFDNDNQIMRRDGEFVIFGQGRHVLSDSEFCGIVIKKLEHDNLKLGPITVLYVKEGFLGGAYERRDGTYKIFYPGPAYLLHEQDYENIQLVNRSSDKFKLGPYEFITVKDDQVAGAYLREGGEFQLLPAGYSYKLHERDFFPVEVKKREDEFTLGPYYYITVRNHFVAGVSTRDGQFVLLPPGKTYRLYNKLYMKPTMQKRDTNQIKLGPVTFLTVPDDKLAGAYRTKDSKFIQFQPSDKPYIINDQDYYGLVVMDKYSEQCRQFGPNKVIRVSSGSCAIFEREGQITLLDEGFHMLSAEYNLKEIVPTKIFTHAINDIQFKTKESISMSVTFSLIWRIEDVKKVALFSGNFKDIYKLIIDKATLTMTKLAQQYNRDRLLPTQQDIAATTDGKMSNQELDELYEKATIERNNLYEQLQSECVASLADLSSKSELGVQIRGINIDNFKVVDTSIITELEKIAKSVIGRREATARGEFIVVQAETAQKEAKAKADMEAFIKIREAETNAKVNEQIAEAQANIRIQAAKAENEANIHIRTAEARAKAESDKILLEAEAYRNLKQAQTEAAALKLESESKANSICLLAEAEAKKTRLEFEARNQMPEKELMLKMMKLQVQGLSEFGKAAWKHPEAYIKMFEEFSDKFRFGATTLEEFMGRMGIDRQYQTNIKN